MFERDNWRLPAAYGDARAGEYGAVREGGAGLLDLSSRGRVRVSGAEAVQFLNGLITNDVKTLAAGEWMPAVFPSVQGRLLAAARVIRQGESFLFDTEPATTDRVLKTLERFTLAGDFRVADMTNAMATLSLQGVRAAGVIGAALDVEVASVERGHVRSLVWNNHELTLIRATHTGEDGFDLFIEQAQAVSLFERLMAAGAQPVGFEALETLRVEAGLPRYGVDMDETNVVLETGLDEAVSYTKGCYVGQEIIARIHWRGHVAKKLTGLAFEKSNDVARGAKVRASDDKEIGRVTSVEFSPRLEKTIALAYVKYDYLAPGTQVRVVTEEGNESAGIVTELPFVRGSWFDGTMQSETLEG